MVQGFILPLAVLAIGGMAWFAYQHPTAYAPLSLALSGAAALAFAIIFAWDMGLQSAETATQPVITLADDAHMMKAISAITIPQLYVMLAYLAFNAYTFGLLLLRFLPKENRP